MDTELVTEVASLQEVAPMFEPTAKNEIGVHWIYEIGEFTGGQFGAGWRVTFGDTPDEGPTGIYLMGGDNEIRADQLNAIRVRVGTFANSNGDMIRRVVGPVVLESKPGKKAGTTIWNINPAPAN